MSALNLAQKAFKIASAAILKAGKAAGLVANKIDKVIPANAGNLARLNSLGGLEDTGVTSTQLALRDPNAAAGDIAVLVQGGDAVSSGKQFAAAFNASGANDIPSSAQIAAHVALEVSRATLETTSAGSIYASTGRFFQTTLGLDGQLVPNPPTAAAGFAVNQSFEIVSAGTLFGITLSVGNALVVKPNSTGGLYYQKSELGLDAFNPKEVFVDKGVGSDGGGTGRNFNKKANPFTSNGGISVLAQPGEMRITTNSYYIGAYTHTKTNTTIYSEAGAGTSTNCEFVGTITINGTGYRQRNIGVLASTSFAAGSFVPGVKYTIESLGTTNFTLIGAASNTVGLEFTATGAGSGTGTAYVKGAGTAITLDDTGAVKVGHQLENVSLRGQVGLRVTAANKGTMNLNGCNFWDTTEAWNAVVANNTTGTFPRLSISATGGIRGDFGSGTFIFVENCPDFTIKTPTSASLFFLDAFGGHCNAIISTAAQLAALRADLTAGTLATDGYYLNLIPNDPNHGAVMYKQSATNAVGVPIATATEVHRPYSQLGPVDVYSAGQRQTYFPFQGTFAALSGVQRAAYTVARGTSFMFDDMQFVVPASGNRSLQFNPGTAAAVCHVDTRMNYGNSASPNGGAIEIHNDKSFTYTANVFSYFFSGQNAAVGNTIDYTLHNVTTGRLYRLTQSAQSATIDVITIERLDVAGPSMAAPIVEKATLQMFRDNPAGFTVNQNFVWDRMSMAGQADQITGNMAAGTFTVKGNINRPVEVYINLGAAQATNSVNQCSYALYDITTPATPVKISSGGTLLGTSGVAWDGVSPFVLHTIPAFTGVDRIFAVRVYNSSNISQVPSINFPGMWSQLTARVV